METTKPRIVELTSEIERLDRGISYWRDRLSKPTPNVQFASLDRQRCKNQIDRLRVERERLLAELTLRGAEYTGPPVTSYELDVSEEKRVDGSVKYFAMPARKACRHTVTASSLTEAQYLALAEHKAHEKPPAALDVVAASNEE